jgi:hypothetical protein
MRRSPRTQAGKGRLLRNPILSFLSGRLEAYLEGLRTLVDIDSGTFNKAGVNAVNDWLGKRLWTIGFLVDRLR